MDSPSINVALDRSQPERCWQSLKANVSVADVIPQRSMLEGTQVFCCELNWQCFKYTGPAMSVSLHIYAKSEH